MDVATPFARLECTRCMRSIPVADAAAHAPATYLCPTCALVAEAPQATPRFAPSTAHLKKPIWPWLAAAGVVAAGVVAAYLIYAHLEKSRAFEAAFPVVPSEHERSVLEHHVRSWKKGRATLVASLAAFDPKAVRVRPDATACSLFQDAPTATEVNNVNTNEAIARIGVADTIERIRNPDPDEQVDIHLMAGPQLGARATAHIEALIAAADRGRFRTDAGRLQVVDAIDSDALVVLELRTDVAPESRLENLEVVLQAGHRAGFAYAFDRESGALGCAGWFEARSSDTVSVLRSTYGGIGTEDDSIRRDFEAQTDRAVARALRVVAPPGDPGAQALADHTRAADEDGEIPTAEEVAASEKRCEGKVMTGCQDAGMAYVRGRGVKRDVAKGLAIFEKACTAEDWASCEALGLVYSQGEGVPADLVRSAAYFKRGCDRAHARSCTDLAVMYVDGMGVDRDRTKAAALFAKACSANDPKGCEALERLNANMP